MKFTTLLHMRLSYQCPRRCVQMLPIRPRLKSVILANSLLNEHALFFSPASLLPFMTFLNNLADVWAHMILKSDCGVGEKMEAYKHGLLEPFLSCPITLSSVENGVINKCAISLHPSWHISDGLLLLLLGTASRITI